MFLFLGYDFLILALRPVNILPPSLIICSWASKDLLTHQQSMCIHSPLVEDRSLLPLQGTLSAQVPNSCVQEPRPTDDTLWGSTIYGRIECPVFFWSDFCSCVTALQAALGSFDVPLSCIHRYNKSPWQCSSSKWSQARFSAWCSRLSLEWGELACHKT